MQGLGPLDPRQQQDQQRAAITAQSQHWEDELTKMLREAGLNTKHEQFTSPWQVAGQVANAFAGRMRAGQNAQNYASLNAALAPGGGEGATPIPSALATPPPVPGAAAAAPAPEASPSNAPAAAPASSQRHGGTPFSPEVKQAIIEGSQAAGVDPNMMAMFAHIESDGNPNAHTGKSRYKGLMQLDDGEMAQMSNGQGSVWNPKDATMAAGLIAKRNQAAFEKFSGRQASPFDTYMMHQQGPAGYMQHIAQPNAPAIQNMLGTAEGRAKGPAWAREAIVENGGHVGDTSAQFIGRWRAKFDRMAQGDLGAFQGGGGGQGAPTQVASLTPTAGGSGAPASSPGGPGGTQVAQTSPAGAAPGQFGIEQIPLSPQVLSGIQHRPAPQYTLPQLQQLYRQGAFDPRYGQFTPEQGRQFYQEIQQYGQPLELDVPGGKLHIAPGAKTGTYYPAIQTKDIDVHGVKVPVQFYIDSSGHSHVIGKAPAAPGSTVPTAGPAAAAPGAKPPGYAPGQDEPFPEGGDIAEISAWAERQAVRQAGEKTSAEENAKIEPEIKKAVGIEAGKAPIDTKKEIAIAEGKVGPNIRQKAGETRAQGQEQDWNAEHRGLTGMGVNLATQAPTLRSLAALAPKAFTGAGTDAMLELNRWADKIGLTYNSAKPREMFDQLATKVLGDQFASMRNASSEEGQQASRIFAAMLKVEEESNLTAKDSLAGTLAKIKRMQRVAAKGMEFADRADRYVRDKGQLDPDFMIQIRKDMADADYDQEEPEPWQIEKLKTNPALREKFEEKFGKGSADKALGEH